MADGMKLVGGPGDGMLVRRFGSVGEIVIFKERVAPFIFDDARYKIEDDGTATYIDTVPQKEGVICVM